MPLKTNRALLILLIFYNIAAITTRSVETERKEISALSRTTEGPDETIAKQVARATKSDPWQKYYDFLINEGSFKFWAVFQVATALVLIYSALAAVYYAKYNLIQADYDYGDYFFGRSDDDASSSFMDNDKMRVFQNILDAISSNKYS